MATASTDDVMRDVHEHVLDRLNTSLNERVVGHGDLKRALLLGLLSGEHIYVEGPPGAAKTMIAETVSLDTDMEFFFYQLHRDTRLNELIGDAVISRSPTAEGGEMIKQKTIPGGILKAEVCVLDDITRCPGEALNVLLRILNERKFGSDPVPLHVAIATGNPSSDDYFVEPLDPANLDRFTYQVSCEGFLSSGEWKNAMSVIDMYASSGSGGSAGAECASGSPQNVGKLLRDATDVLLPQVHIGRDMKLLLLTVLKTLRDRFALTSANSLLTDRTFLVKSTRALRASAVLDKRMRCEPEDLLVLELLTTFRVPSDVHTHVKKLIEDVIAGKIKMIDPSSVGLGDEEEEEKSDDDGANGGDDDGGASDATGGDGGASSGSDSADTGGADDGQRSDTSASSAGEGSSAGASAHPSSSQSENASSNAEASSMSGSAGEKESTHTSNREEGGGGSKDQERDPPSRYVSGFKKSDKSGKSDTSSENAKSRADVLNMDEVLNVLDGVIGGGSATLTESAAGSPRRWQACRNFADFDDIDAVDRALWLDDPTPRIPNRKWRGAKAEGGYVAILRDTSRSMVGAWATWASVLSSRLVEMARKKRMRLGYVEFNHQIKCTSVAADEHVSPFFSSDYERLLELTSRVDCGGVTNYQLPLRYALGKFFEETRKERGLSVGASHADECWSLRDPTKRSGGRVSASGRRLIRDFYNDFETQAKRTTWVTMDESVSSNVMKTNGRNGMRGQHLIFLTDGVPTSGDRVLAEELAFARRNGVQIHTLFMGRSNFPTILHKMSLSTGGARFSAWKNTRTNTVSVRRHRGEVALPCDAAVENAVLGAGAESAFAYEPSKTWMRWFERQCN